MTLHNIFYIFIAFPITWELMSLVHMRKVLAFDKNIHERKEPMTPFQALFVFLHLGYSLWLMVGMFTAHWMFFLMVIFLNWLKNSGPNFILDGSSVKDKEKLKIKIHETFAYVDCIGTVLALVSLYVDVYHLHLCHMKPFWMNL